MVFLGCLVCGESGGIFKVAPRQQRGDVPMFSMHVLDPDLPPGYNEAHSNRRIIVYCAKLESWCFWDV